MTEPEVASSPFETDVSDFATLRQQGKYYVDHTRFLGLWHDYDIYYGFLHRPPRFGKSLFLSTLESYYDIAVDEETHQRLFAGLDIEQDPPPRARGCYILKCDFKIDAITTLGPEGIERVFHNKINGAILRFAAKYHFPANNLPLGIVTAPPAEGRLSFSFDESNGLSTFGSLLNFLSFNELPLLLLFDDYDHFANALVFEDPGRHNLFVRGTPLVQGLSFLCSVFEIIKNSTGSFICVFSAGVNPVFFDTSCAVYFKDVENLNALADIGGFHHSDLSGAIDLLVTREAVSPEQKGPLLALMETFMCGYRFNQRRREAVYNPHLCLHLLKQLWVGTVKISALLTEQFDWATLAGSILKVNEKIFRLWLRTLFSIWLWRISRRDRWSSGDG